MYKIENNISEFSKAISPQAVSGIDKFVIINIESMSMVESQHSETGAGKSCIILNEHSKKNGGTEKYRYIAL